MLSPAESRGVDVVSPVRPGWIMVDRLSHEMDMFCRDYIEVNQLTFNRGFRGGGARRLRETFEADLSMRREQFTDAQSHILFLLAEQHEQFIERREDAGLQSDQE